MGPRGWWRGRCCACAALCVCVCVWLCGCTGRVPAAGARLPTLNLTPITPHHPPTSLNFSVAASCFSPGFLSCRQAGRQAGRPPHQHGERSRPAGRHRRRPRHGWAEACTAGGCAASRRCGPAAVPLTGWYLMASLRYAFLSWSSVASRSTPSICGTGQGGSVRLAGAGGATPSSAGTEAPPLHWLRLLHRSLAAGRRLIKCSLCSNPSP